MPDITLTVVDFPAPFGPMYPTNSPGSIEKLTPSSASTVWYRRRTMPRIAPQTPASRSEIRKRFTRSSTIICGIP